MSFLRCHKFVNDRSLLDAEDAMGSLTAEIRGVSDPIVASYLRISVGSNQIQILSISFIEVFFQKE